MKIVVVGAGAVGAFFGLKLAQTGASVSFLLKPGRAADYQEHGLSLQLGGQRLAPPVNFSEDPVLLRSADLVLVCVKSGQTAEVARQLAQYLAPSAVVLSLQNGISNAPILARQLTQPVIPTAVYVAVQRSTPYQVEHRGRGELALGREWQAAPWAPLFAQAGIPLLWGDRIEVLQWEKLVMNCALNALSALTELSYGQLARIPAVPALLDALVAECVSVAHAEGMALPADIRQRLDHLIEGMAGQRSSTHADVSAHRPSEIEAINGEIVKRAQAHGLAAPANLALYAAIQALDLSATTPN